MEVGPTLAINFNHQRQCDALALVERALCLIENTDGISNPYARLLQQALDEAATIGIVATNYGYRSR